MIEITIFGDDKTAQNSPDYRQNGAMFGSNGYYRYLGSGTQPPGCNQDHPGCIPDHPGDNKDHFGDIQDRFGDVTDHFGDIPDRSGDVQDLFRYKTKWSLI